MKIQKTIEVWLAKKRLPRPIDVVQYDTGIQLVFAIQDFAIPSGTTATLYVQKPSGKFVYQATGITLSEKSITIDLENQAITEHGNSIPYQVQLTNGADTITTFAGIFRVEKSCANVDAEESHTVITSWNEMTADKIAAIQAAAQEQIEVIQNLNRSFATKNEAAYAIKGNLSGAVVFADDVSPVEHNPVVKVRGANLIPFPYYNKSGVVNGITYTINDDGSVTAKGTATANAALYLTYGLSGIKGTVFLSGCPSGGSISSTGGGYSLRMNKFVNGVEVTGGADVGSGNKITLNGEDVRIYIVVLSGKTVDCTFRPMLNYGDSANDFVKSDLTAVKVRRCGKNIFGVAAKSQTINGVTFAVNNNGTVTATGTAEKTTFIGLGSLVLKPGEKYRLSGSPAGSGFDTYLLYIHNNTTGADIYDMGEGKVFTGKDGDLGVTIAVYAGNTVNNLIFRPMVVYGEAATDFEPYNAATYIPAADGTVSGMTSLSPNMTILTDTDGAIVECEYNADTETYIKKMIAGASAIRVADVELLSSAWVGTASPYSQVITIAGTTEYSQVNLNPSVEQMAIFYEKDLTFVTENDDGVITVYAIGQKPSNDYTIQATIKEVSA